MGSTRPDHRRRVPFDSVEFGSSIALRATDRFGVSWQIIPDALPRMLGADDREAGGRAMQAMLQMKKIDIAALEAAFRGE